jgi:small subunit ribosomal protein S13
MLRISGVVLPGQKRIAISMMSIKGIGRSLATSILKELNMDPLTKTDDIKEADQTRLRMRIEKELTEGELNRKVSLDIKRLQDIGTWRGHRHKKKLPVRGQSSKRNARTRRGKKKTGTSGRTVLTKT